MNVSQLGSNLHVVFERAPSSFGFTIYYLYYKLRQDGPFKLQRCKPVSAREEIRAPRCRQQADVAVAGFSKASDSEANLRVCVQDVNQLRTTCILQDITPGIYTIEVSNKCDDCLGG